MKHSAFSFLTIALSSATIAVPGEFANAPAADFDQLRRAKGVDFDKLRRENLDKDAFSFPVQIEQ